MNKMAKIALLSLILVALFAVTAEGQQQSKSVGAADEFFIISSVNAATHQIVFKQPTEVTVLMTVNEQTKYFDEKGAPLQFKDLRAGDTVFVNWAVVGGAGPPLASKIRRGPMTQAELRRRYLSH